MKKIAENVKVYENSDLCKNVKWKRIANSEVFENSIEIGMKF